MADFQDFVPGQRLGPSVSISADGAVVAFASDVSGQFNLWTQPVNGGAARQLTAFTGRTVRDVAWSPDGSEIAFSADTSGNELYDIYLIEADGGTPAKLTSMAGAQHNLAEKNPFDPAGRYLLGSVNDRAAGASDLFTCRLPAGSPARFPGPGGGTTFAIAPSPDGRLLLGGAITANTRCQCYVASLDEPGAPVAPVTGDLPGEYYYPGPWTGDGAGFYLHTTDGDGDHVCLARFSLADRALTIVDSPPWNVEDVIVPADGRMVTWVVNEAGYSVLHAVRDGQPVAVPAIPAGVIRAMSCSADGSVLALLLDSPGRPAEIVIARPGTAEPARFLTDTRPPGLRSRQPVRAELISFPAADGTPVPAFLYRPPGPGPHPVLLSIHGGPEGQARPRYDPLHECLLADGIAVLTPNIHGSSGYGHAWQTRIYRDWGGIDLADLAAARDWLGTQGWADPDRVAVYGMSYGGFAALSCMTRLPGRWAAGVSVCGPSNLETLARSMPPDWAGAVAAMFGDVGDPEDVRDLRRRSPLSYASQISAPLLVIQGATDPRVPQAEADQIVAAARANGADVRYEVFADEGHGFTSRQNHIKAHTVITEFLREHLRKPGGSP
jgi:dipeptidyl aminopeptidase/acylaminoacyl peptidase